MVFLTIGLMVGIATIVTLITLTASMSSDIGRKMDEFGANTGASADGGKQAGRIVLG